MTDDTKQTAPFMPEPWDCSGATTLYATPDESGEMTMIEVRANVTETGWNTVAFIEAIWPGARANARRICAAVNACKGLDTEALERGVIAELRHALGELLTAASDLDAAIDGVTDQFDAERGCMNAAIRTAQSVLDAGTEINVHQLLAGRKHIAAIWSVEDMQGIRPDLTAEQAWEVLQEAQHKHDAMMGISWDTLEILAEDLFGPAPETTDEEE